MVPDRADPKEEIRQLLKKINRAWIEGQTEILNEVFHEDMMIVSPDFQILGRGREACVKSYKDFMRQATLRKFTESEATIEVWEHTAVASYRFDMAWEKDGQSFQDAGRDVFVFSLLEDQCQAVWRTILPLPEEASSG